MHLLSEPLLGARRAGTVFSYIYLRAYFLAVAQYSLNITLFILRARTHPGTFINAVSLRE